MMLILVWIRVGIKNGEMRAQNLFETPLNLHLNSRFVSANF